MRDRKTDGYRAVAARTLGRPIKPGHDIDHRNSNKEDNSPANLQELPHGVHSSKTGKKENRTLAKLQRALAIGRSERKLY